MSSFVMFTNLGGAIMFIDTLRLRHRCCCDNRDAALASPLWLRLPYATLASVSPLWLRHAIDRYAALANSPRTTCNLGDYTLPAADDVGIIMPLHG